MLLPGEPAELPGLSLRKSPHGVVHTRRAAGGESDEDASPIWWIGEPLDETPSGSHITEILLNDVAIDPTATYLVGVNSFLAPGGDNFFTLDDRANKADSGKIDLESMVDYFATFGTATPDSAQRDVGVVVSAPHADGYDAGDQVTVNLSSLDFSTNEPAAATVAISPGGVGLGTGTTGLTEFDITTETGTASSFTIPVD